MQDLTVIIPIAENDVGSLKKSLPYIMNNISARKFVVIAPHCVKKCLTEIRGVEFINEDEIDPNLTYNKIRHLLGSIYPKAERRTGWYFQQFLKLSYSNICTTTYYMSWDSDTYPIHEIDFFETTEKPYLDYLPYVNDDEDYFVLLDKISSNQYSFHKKNKDSFITEHMIFSVDIVKELLASIEKNQNLHGSFYWEKIIYSIPLKSLNLSGFSEFETYASFILNYHSNDYVLREWNNLRNGRYYVGPNPSWKVIEWVGKDFNVLSLEDYDRQSLIMKLVFMPLRVYEYIRFKQIYILLNPIYTLQYRIRMYLRKKIRS